MRILLTWVAMFAAAFVATAVATALLEQPDYPGGLTRTEAQYHCEEAIKGRSVNPVTVEFRRPTELRAGEFVQYTWKPDQLQMQNKFGAMLGMSAECKINTRTRQLVSLNLQ